MGGRKDLGALEATKVQEKRKNHAENVDHFP